MGANVFILISLQVGELYQKSTEVVKELVRDFHLGSLLVKVLLAAADEGTEQNYRDTHWEEGPWREPHSGTLERQ